MSSYDQTLLGEAPKATRAQLQEGYNVDLLEPAEPPRRTPSVRSPPPQSPNPVVPVTVPLTQAIAENGSGEKFGSPAQPISTAKSKTSFWRTRNGIITIAVVALVVIGAVVGGAVGGTVGNKSSSSNNNNNVLTTSSSHTSTSTSTSTAHTSTAGQAGSPTSVTQAVAGGTAKPSGFSTTAATPSASGQNNIG